jgi:hypothetical protein
MWNVCSSCNSDNEIVVFSLDVSDAVFNASTYEGASPGGEAHVADADTNDGHAGDAGGDSGERNLGHGTENSREGD